MNKPPYLVWLPMDHRPLGSSEKQMLFLVLGDKYARAIKDAALAQPVPFPLAYASQTPDLLNLVDGVMLTGSSSNVHPSQFNEEVSDADLPLDRARDALPLALKSACIKQCVPLRGHGIGQTAQGLRVLGYAPDALVEAFGKACRARQNDRLNNSEHTLHAAAGSP